MTMIVPNRFDYKEITDTTVRNEASTCCQSDQLQAAPYRPGYRDDRRQAAGDQAPAAPRHVYDRGARMWDRRAPGAQVYGRVRDGGA